MRLIYIYGFLGINITPSDRQIMIQANGRGLDRNLITGSRGAFLGTSAWCPTHCLLISAHVIAAVETKFIISLQMIFQYQVIFIHPYPKKQVSLTRLLGTKIYCLNNWSQKTVKKKSQKIIAKQAFPRKKWSKWEVMFCKMTRHYNTPLYHAVFITLKKIKPLCKVFVQSANQFSYSFGVRTTTINYFISPDCKSKMLYSLMDETTRGIFSS